MSAAKHVLVAYASAHGSTAGIAQAIGDRLIRAGLRVDVRAIADCDDVDPYDALLVGSAVHDQAWLPQAAAFLRSHARGLGSRPVWLFSVSSFGETSSFFGPRLSRLVRQMRRDTPEMAELRQLVAPRDHRHFAGAIEASHWNRLGDLVMKAFGGRYGDHRDWQDIEAWAAGIARQLEAEGDARRHAA